MFAAGAGPGSGAARKDTMDRGGAVLLADAAELAGVRRYVMVSAMGADAGPQPDHDEVFAAYITAKKAADDDIRARDLDWTILRPGGLTLESGTGLVELAEHTERGRIPREDVAAVLLALLDEPTDRRPVAGPDQRRHADRRGRRRAGRPRRHLAAREGRVGRHRTRACLAPVARDGGAGAMEHGCQTRSDHVH